MKIPLIATGACLLLLMFSETDCGWRRRHQRQLDCVPDSSILECFDAFENIFSDDTLCSNCRSILEEYTRRCVSETAADIEETFKFYVMVPQFLTLTPHVTLHHPSLHVFVSLQKSVPMTLLRAVSSATIAYTRIGIVYQQLSDELPQCHYRTVLQKHNH